MNEGVLFYPDAEAQQTDLTQRSSHSTLTGGHISQKKLFGASGGSTDRLL